MVGISLPWANGKVGNAVIQDAKGCIGVNKVQVSPIDAHVVAAAVEDVLLVVAEPSVSLCLKAIVGLSNVVAADLAGCIEVYLEFVSLVKHSL